MSLLGYVWYSKPVKKVKSLVTYALPSDDIWERDWDVLIILDACRVDLFEEVVGPTPTITSPAATSSTWIRRTFDRDVSNIGYVTGNGHIGEMPVNEFAYFHIQSPEWIKYEIEAVHPNPIVDHAIHAWRNKERYDLDRLIVHFMQPHAPFRSKPEWFDPDEAEGGLSRFIWQRLRRGEFTHDEVWEAYRDNLEWILEDGVSTLQDNMDGKIIVSADHGNAIGEFGFYGHPMGCPHPIVREVPWYEIEGNDNGSYEPAIDEANTSTDVEEHLQALGYFYGR